VVYDHGQPLKGAAFASQRRIASRQRARNAAERALLDLCIGRIEQDQPVPQHFRDARNIARVQMDVRIPRRMNVTEGAV